MRHAVLNFNRLVDPQMLIKSEFTPTVQKIIGFSPYIPFPDTDLKKFRDNIVGSLNLGDLTADDFMDFSKSRTYRGTLSTVKAPERNYWKLW